MPADDPLTPKELAFRLAIRADGVDEQGRRLQGHALKVAPKYSAWAELARKSWTDKRGSATPAETEPRRKNK
jgi:hypothetical protein